MSNESNKELKKKIRGIARESNRKDRMHDFRLREIEKELADLLDRVSALEEGANGKPPGHPLVIDLPSLKNFVVAHFGVEWCSEYVTELKIKCGPVRDILAETFDHIQRINDQLQHPSYPNVDENKHRDAIFFNVPETDEWIIIDFCKGSSGPGHLWNPKTRTGNIAWSHIDETPW